MVEGGGENGEHRDWFKGERTQMIYREKKLRHIPHATKELSIRHKHTYFPIPLTLQPDVVYLWYFKQFMSNC